jgi:zinc transport system ATP-binding protein
MERKILELQSVDAGYNSHKVISDASLEVCDHDFIGMIGPNGGGKTTLIKVILGVLKPFKGKVIYHQVYDQNHVKRIGYLPQFSMIDQKFPISAREVVMSGLMPHHGLTRRYSGEDKKRAQEMLEKMGVGHLKDKVIGQLSGGQMQRVFLARAVVGSPNLLILDEPGTFVDNQFEGELYEHLRELNKEMAIILVTHDIGTISSYVKTIACVNQQVHYHKSNVITEQQLSAYNCPIQLITHGEVPHTVLKKHQKDLK